VLTPKTTMVLPGGGKGQRDAPEYGSAYLESSMLLVPLNRAAQLTLVQKFFDDQNLKNN
jgi:hypothetical protein